MDCKINPKTCSISCLNKNDGKRYVVPHTDPTLSKFIRDAHKECRRKQQLLALNVFQKPTRKNCDDMQDDPTLFQELKTEEIQKLRENLQDQFDTKVIYFTKVLGVGQFGIAIEICSPDKDLLYTVVKYAKKGASLRAEKAQQAKFAKVGLAPQLIDPVPKYLPYFIMAKVDGTVDQLLQYNLTTRELNEIAEESLQLIFRMCQHNMTHGDLHFANIAYITDPKDPNTKTYMCIDFAETLYGCHPEIDLLQLIRDTYNKKYTIQNRIFLRSIFHKVYEYNYHVTLPDNSFDAVSARRLSLLQEHILNMQKYARYYEETQIKPKNLMFKESLSSDEEEEEEEENEDEEGDEQDDEGDEQEEEEGDEGDEKEGK